jgi:hypothetical protein
MLGAANSVSTTYANPACSNGYARLNSIIYLRMREGNSTCGKVRLIAPARIAGLISGLD